MATRKKHKTLTKPNLILIATLLVTAPRSGCVMLDEASSEDLQDGELVIVTYDVLALSEDMISGFEESSGLNVTMLKLDEVCHSGHPEDITLPSGVCFGCEWR